MARSSLIRELRRRHVFRVAVAYVVEGGLPVISRKWRADLIATKKLIEERP